MTDRREPCVRMKHASGIRFLFALAVVPAASVVVATFIWSGKYGSANMTPWLPYVAAVYCAIAIMAPTFGMHLRYRRAKRMLELETAERRQAEKRLEDMEAAFERVGREPASKPEASRNLLENLCSVANREQFGKTLLEHMHDSLPYDIFAVLQDAGESLDVAMQSKRPLEDNLIRELREQLVEAYVRETGGRLLSTSVNIRVEPRAATKGSLSPIATMHPVIQTALFGRDGVSPVGILLAASEEPQTASQAELELVRTIVDDAAVALQRFPVTVSPEQQHLAKVVEQLPEGMILLDSEGGAILLNPAAEEYVGILGGVISDGRLTELGSHPLAKLLGPPPIGKLHHEIEVAFPVRRVFEIEARPMELCPPVQGRLLMLREVTRDREVQQRVLQQEQLAAIGQLASGIAHDFNNLLMGMIGFGQLLQLRPGMPENSKHDLEQIVGLGQKAANLVRQVLDFSRKSVSQRSPFDLGLFVKETTKFLQRTIPENIHISLDITPDQRGYLVEADPAQIRQVVMNLALNSRDAMPEGGELQIRVAHLSLKASDQRPIADLAPGEWVELSISDTGTGISQETMQHIFEPFFTTKEVGRGTGLGLAQVYGIIKQHDGSIDVKSVEGQGATVSIFLPAVASSVEESPIAREGEIQRGQGEVIMLVEDEPELLHLGVQMIESLGYVVVPAANGSQAIAEYKEHLGQIALVITDMVMPDIGGLELLRELTRINPRLKAIVLSGYSLEEDKEKLSAQGILNQIQKPVKIAQLAESIHQAIAENTPAQP